MHTFIDIYLYMYNYVHEHVHAHKYKHFEWWQDEIKYLNISMKSDNTDPQHRSISSIITTTGVLWFSCSLYHDAKMDISASCLNNFKY